MFGRYSLEDILHEDIRLYLVFEFMHMDLKKYLDSLKGKMMDPMLVKVRIIFVVVKVKHDLRPMKSPPPPVSSIETSCSRQNEGNVTLLYLILVS